MARLGTVGLEITVKSYAFLRVLLLQHIGKSGFENQPPPFVSHRPRLHGRRIGRNFLVHLTATRNSERGSSSVLAEMNDGEYHDRKRVISCFDDP